MANLKLTQKQVEILGYALTSALRKEKTARVGLKVGSQIDEGYKNRIQRIEELRCELDAQCRQPA